MLGRDNYSEIAPILEERGADAARMEKWLECPYNVELAEAMVQAWRELEESYRAEFGDDAELRDEMSEGDVEERFKLRGRVK